MKVPGRIDRFMSECPAITNLIGNGVATVAISLWEGEVTPAQLTANLNHELGPAEIGPLVSELPTTSQFDSSCIALLPVPGFPVAWVKGKLSFIVNNTHDANQGEPGKESPKEHENLPELMAEFTKAIEAYGQAASASQTEQAEAAALQMLCLASEEAERNPSPELLLAEQARTGGGRWFRGSGRRNPLPG